MKRIIAWAANFLVVLALVTGASVAGAQEARAGAEKDSANAGSVEESAAAKASTEKAASDAEASAEAAGTVPSGAMDGETYRIRLRDLEQRVDELKEQIRRSHTRLSLLSDTILSGASGGGRAEIEFVNELSGAWHVVEAVFVLDGAVQYKKNDDTGVLAKQKTIPIFSGTVPTGDHTLQVMLKLRGHGFGVFSYLRGVEATVKSSHSFTLSEGKVMRLTATAWEKGGPTTPVEEQPSIRFNSTMRNLVDMPKAAPASSSRAGQGEAKTQPGKAGSKKGSASLSAEGGSSPTGAGSED